MCLINSVNFCELLPFQIQSVNFCIKGILLTKGDCQNFLHGDVETITKKQSDMIQIDVMFWIVEYILLCEFFGSLGCLQIPIIS